MTILVAVASLFASADTPADAPNAFSAQAVTWRDTTSPRNEWDVYMLVRNETKKRVFVPRWPHIYNTCRPRIKKVFDAVHYDGFSADYPDHYDALEPKQVQVWKLSIKSVKQPADKDIEMVLDASFVAYVDGKPKKCSVECFLFSRVKPAPEAWLEQKLTEFFENATSPPQKDERP
jgi:hypothetical protein